MIRFTGLAAVILLAIISINQSAHAEGFWRKKLNDVFGGEQKQASVVPKSLTTEEISRAFREALSIGARKVVEKLGKPDGFNTDPFVRILLPEELEKTRKVLKKIRLEKYADELEVKLNRAAELAAPKATDLFLNAIRSLSFRDVMDIYNGPDDSATRYFQKAMTPALSKSMRPIVDNSLSKVKAARTYEKLVKSYNKVPFTNKVNADLSGHVVEKAIAGIFHYMGKEEAAIRKDPVRQTTDLLKRVFGLK